MRALLRRLFVHEPHPGAHASYIALVARARNPFFYTTLGVPDTLDGRFEMILVHLFLLQHRMMAAQTAQAEPDASQRSQETPRTISPRSGASWRGQQAEPDASINFSRELSELFFADMDRNVRELGVADTGVRYRIKAMAKAYHGRLIAYTESIDDDHALRGALARNLYGTVAEGDVAHLSGMADYMQRMRSALAATPTETLLHGAFDWERYETASTVGATNPTALRSSVSA